MPGPVAAVVERIVHAVKGDVELPHATEEGSAGMYDTTHGVPEPRARRRLPAPCAPNAPVAALTGVTGA